MSDILDARTACGRFGGPSFSLRNRVVRGVFQAVWLFCARWTPPAFYRWRRFILRMFGANMAINARVYGSTKIWYPANLTMGENALIGPNVNCYNQGQITLGAHSVVSQFTHLVAGTHDIDDEHFQLLVRPINVGTYAWIASNCFVGPGVTVGDGAVLGACGVTFKDLESWTVYGGNPVKQLRGRKQFA